jgi:hypothetical protein
MFAHSALQNPTEEHRKMINNERLFNSPVIFQILTNKRADMYFRSLATENSSEYSTRENITDYSTSGRGEYFKQTLIIIFIQRNYYFLTKLTEQ